MTIYVLDNALQLPAHFKKIADKLARNWKALVGFDQDPVFVTWNPRDSFRQIKETGFELLPQLQPGIVILHNPSDQEIQAIATAREGEPRMVAIQVRCNAYDGQPSERDWFYYVRTEFDIEDLGFSERFKRFWTEFVKSGGRSRKFSLLEPTSVPEPLLAYVLAVQYRLSIPNILELSTAADVCYGQVQSFAQSLLSKKEQGPVSFPEVGVPLPQKFDSSPGDPNGTRFKAMRNVIELLREDL